MKHLRERCEKFYEELSWDVTVEKIESFAREIRNETLEEIALHFGEGKYCSESGNAIYIAPHLRARKTHEKKTKCDLGSQRCL